MSFPSLIGGTVIREDLAPSVVFAILYGSLVLLAAFRLLRKNSRTTLLINTVIFCIERVVIFSLRAVQSRNISKAASHSLTTYEQVTLGMGYISISQGLIGFLKVLLVNTTKPDSRDEVSMDKAFDQPPRRLQYRRLTGYLDLAFWSSIIPGTIAATELTNSINNSVTARRVMRLRYAGSGVALFLTITMGVICFVALQKINRMPKTPAYIFLTLCCLLSTVPIYQMAIMHNTVDSLLSRGPGSLSSPTAKTLFYVLQIVPEWLAAAILLGQNSRRTFNTGPFGDRQEKKPKKQANTNENDGGNVMGLDQRGADPKEQTNTNENDGGNLKVLDQRETDPHLVV